MTAGRPLSGFSMVRDAIAYGYPVGEALRSVAPLVDELVVAVGKSGDGTFDLVRGLGIPHLRVIETEWDDALRRGGEVLAQQTNLALAQCRHPWAFYIQADEVVHEDDYAAIGRSLARWYDDENVDALRFRFVHFEGTYAYVNVVRYRRQSRIVRTDGRLVSVKDAAGFGRVDGARLRSRSSGARIFHYGWARAPEIMKKKTVAFERLWLDDAAVEARWKDVAPEEMGEVEIAFRFRGTHPAVMQERVGSATWEVPPHRRPPFDSPLLSPAFYAAWLRKWHILPRPG